MSSDGEGKVLAYLFVGFFGGLVMFFSSFKKFRNYQTMRNTPTSNIRSLAMGLVEIYGKVLPDMNDTVLTPFTKRKCVYCKYQIQEYVHRNKSSSWRTIRSGYKGNHFFIRDKTGTVLVNPIGAELDIKKDTEVDKLTQKHKDILASEWGIKNADKWLGRNIRIKEWYLEEGEDVYVLGTADDNPFVEEATSKSNEADIMIQKKNDNVFYISDAKEDAVISRMFWRTFGSLIGGGALSTVCLGFLILYFMFRFR